MPTNLVKLESEINEKAPVPRPKITSNTRFIRIYIIMKHLIMKQMEAFTLDS